MPPKPKVEENSTSRKAAATASNRRIVEISVRGSEKRYQPSRCYMFIIEVTWNDSSKYIVYRSYSDIFNLQLALAEAFPIEAGEVDEKERILPKLKAGKIGLAAYEARKLADKRTQEAAKYFNDILMLEDRFTSFPGFLAFFDAKPEDLDVPRNARTKKEKKFRRYFPSFGKKSKREVSDPVSDDISGPLQAESYLAIAAYKSKAKGEVSFNEGDLVDVIDKNATGWWFVRVDDQEGWAPSSYLDPVQGNTADEQPCLAGETYITIKAYTAQMEDELSFPACATVEVMNKILDGWWIASYDGKVGYVPSTYMKKYSNPHLTPKPAADEKPRSPAPRRKTIKGAAAAPERDLGAYRKLSEKRKSRVASRRSAQRKSSKTAPSSASGPEENGTLVKSAGTEFSEDESAIEQYKAAADYAASGQGEVDLKQGDVVSVIQKNVTGWWFVKTEDNREGWAPSSYLDSQSLEVVDEQPCLAGEQYVAIVAYTAQLTDELNFPEGAQIEIMNKILDGWWIGSYGGQVGYVPSTYLRPLVESQALPQKENALRAPAPRRMTIKGIAPTPERDLGYYAKISTKRRQRTIKKMQREKTQAFLEEEEETEYETAVIVTQELEVTAIPRSSVNSDEDCTYEAVISNVGETHSTVTDASDRTAKKGKPPVAPKPLQFSSGNPGKPVVSKGTVATTAD